ncbi:MAG: glycerophosphodiester phosphodiesterase [Pseudomonadota bacterium]
MSLISACASARPTVVAHRGASGYLPEHSLAAVAAAHIMNVDYIEQDVVLSKDGVPVVLHDIHLESTTNVEQVFPNRSREDGRFYALDFDLAELKQLTLHERQTKEGSAVFGSRFPVGDTPFRIPTLQEEIDLIQGMNTSRGTEIGLYIELKKPRFHLDSGYKIDEVVLKTLSENQLDKKDSKVILQCFDSETTQRLRKMTELTLIQLVGLNAWRESSTDYEKMMTLEGLEEVARYADGIGPYIGFFVDENGNAKNKALIEKAKSLGLEVHGYTFRADQFPDQFGSFAEFIAFFDKDIGITGYFSDHPDQALRALERPSK